MTVDVSPAGSTTSTLYSPGSTSRGGLKSICPLGFTVTHSGVFLPGVNASPWVGAVCALLTDVCSPALTTARSDEVGAGATRTGTTAGRPSGVTTSTL